jgi:hypothetical protein
MKAFVILEGLNCGIWDCYSDGDCTYKPRFITTNSADPTKMSDGTIQYKIIGYADSIEEAQIQLFGRSYS